MGNEFDRIFYKRKCDNFIEWTEKASVLFLWLNEHKFKGCATKDSNPRPLASSLLTALLLGQFNYERERESLFSCDEETTNKKQSKKSRKCVVVVVDYLVIWFKESPNLG